MKETPILFTPANIRAILDGRKTQTRRAINPQPPRCTQNGTPYTGSQRTTLSVAKGFDLTAYLDEPRYIGKSMYGEVGERLWVREGFLARANGKAIVYRMDYTEANGAAEAAGFGAMYGGWKSAIFMPKSAARLWLEVTDVRVERVQDISEQDAIAEGVFKDRVIVGANCNSGIHVEEYGDRFWPTAEDTRDEGFEDAVSAYAALWDSINGKAHPWSENPWCWVIGFRRVQV